MLIIVTNKKPKMYMIKEEIAIQENIIDREKIGKANG